MEILRDGLAGFGAGFLVYLIVAAGKKLIRTLQDLKSLGKLGDQEGEEW